MGSVLLVGITVVSAVGLGLLIFAFEGPAEVVHADIELRIDPGADSTWATADEKVQILHLGGEPLTSGATIIAFEVGVAAYRYSGDSLGSSFADGSLTIGEVWESDASLTLNEDTGVAVDVISTLDQSTIVATGLVTGRGTIASGGTACLGDTTPPTAFFTRDPSDLTVVTVDLTLQIDVTLIDLCEVNVGAPLTLVWEWGDDTPDENSIAMAHQSGTTWRATLPAQTWATRLGQTLYFQVNGMADLKTPPNVGSSPVQSDTIGASYTYPSALSTRTGTVSSFANMQASGDSLSATLTEGASAPVELSGNSATGTMTNPSRSLTSNNQYATSATNEQYSQVTGFDVPAAATGIRQVVLGLEAKETGAGADPTMRFDWRVGSTGAFRSTAAFSISGTDDADYTIDITNERDWTIADVEALQVRGVLTNTRAVSLNWIFVSAIEAIPSGSTQAAAVVFDFANTPDTAADTYSMEVRYTAAIDTFSFQVWDGTRFTTRAGTTLPCSGMSCYAYTLTAAEYNAGTPKLRILDATPGGSGVGTMTIDYARVFAS